MTWAEWFAEAERRLALAGLDDPRHEARAIAGAVMPPNTRFHMPLNTPVDAEWLAQMNRILDARVARQPLSQIIGKRDFWKHEFRVTQDTLDPRPDTETLVEAALKLPWNRWPRRAGAVSRISPRSRLRSMSRSRAGDETRSPGRTGGARPRHYRGDVGPPAA